MSIIFDRIVSVGGWLHGIEYKHIATELPLRRHDFETDVRRFSYFISVNHDELHSSITTTLSNSSPAPHRICKLTIFS